MVYVFSLILKELFLKIYDTIGTIREHSVLSTQLGCELEFALKIVFSLKKKSDHMYLEFPYGTVCTFFFKSVYLV